MIFESWKCIKDKELRVWDWRYFLKIDSAFSIGYDILIYATKGH